MHFSQLANIAGVFLKISKEQVSLLRKEDEGDRKGRYEHYFCKTSLLPISYRNLFLRDMLLKYF